MSLFHDKAKNIKIISQIQISNDDNILENTINKHRFKDTRRFADYRRVHPLLMPMFCKSSGIFKDNTRESVKSA